MDTMTEMPEWRCETCAWWDKWDKAALDASYFARTNRHLPIMDEPFDRGYCRLVGVRTNDVDPAPHALAEATCEDEQIGGELVTQESFGCIQWEAKV